MLRKCIGILALLFSLSFRLVSPWLLLLSDRIRPANYTIASWMSLSAATTRQRWRVFDSSSSCIANPS